MYSRLPEPYHAALLVCSVGLSATLPLPDYGRFVRYSGRMRRRQVGPDLRWPAVNTAEPMRNFTSYLRWELKFNSRVPNYGQKALRRVTHVAAAVQIGLR